MRASSADEITTLPNVVACQSGAADRNSEFQVSEAHPDNLDFAAQQLGNLCIAGKASSCPVHGRRSAKRSGRPRRLVDVRRHGWSGQGGLQPNRKPKRRQTKFMQKTYVAWTQSTLIQVLPVKMPFLRLLDELERSESIGRDPKLKLGPGFRLSRRDFGQFCQRNLLHLAGQWNGISVYVRPDFIWPS